MAEGATVEEWQTILKALGFAKKDILPVVSKTDAQVSENSTMKDLGKTPSLYNSERKVVGIAKWTSKKASDTKLETWQEEEDYGICIQTRYIRGIDIDVEDKAQAREIAKEIEDFLGFCLPRRTRENSGKMLLAVAVDGEFGKQTVKVDGGMVEFLANGQQFIAAGTHPSGVRYGWGNTLNEGFPALSKEQWDDLVWFIEEGFGIAPATKRGLRKKGDADYAEADDVIKLLEEKGLVHEYGNEGQAHIECPFAHEHTTEGTISSTSYFPAGSRGYEQGHFVCLHAHCEGRSDQDFLKALGAELAGFDVPDLSERGEDEPEPLPNWVRNKQGEPLALLNNVIAALHRPDICGASIHYDKFKDEITFRDFETDKWERENDDRLIKIRSKLEGQYGFKPIGRELIRDAVHTVSRANERDNAQEWLNSLEWDGVCRCERFVEEYLGGQANTYTRAVSLYIWTAAAGRVIEPGVKADMIPIMKGPQGYRKSTAISLMAPSLSEFAELDFDTKDDDLARKMRGKLVCEIPELRGLRTKAIEAIKAFVARTHEQWIPKYKEYSTEFARRCVFIATTNEDEFLADGTGNRRWLPFDVVRHTDTDAIVHDRAQLWAEAAVLFKENGVMWQRAEELAVQEHEKYMIRDTWFDVISDWLYRPEGLDGEGVCPIDKGFLTTLEVAQDALNLQISKLNKLEEMKIATALKAHGYENTRQYVEVGGERKRLRVWSPQFSELA